MRWTPGGSSDDVEDRRDDSGGGGGFQIRWPSPWPGWRDHPVRREPDFQARLSVAIK